MMLLKILDDVMHSPAINPSLMFGLMIHGHTYATSLVSHFFHVTRIKEWRKNEESGKFQPSKYCDSEWNIAFAAFCASFQLVRV